MSDDLMEELRIMANEHDDELCRYALDRFALLEEAIDQYRKALSQSSSRIEALEAALRNAYKDCLNAVEKVKSDPFTELGVHHKGKWGDTTARDWMVAFAEDVEREIKARAALGEKKE